MRNSYFLNERLEITSVDGAWDSFARKNKAEACFAQHVVGRSVLDFIEGEDCADFYRRLFAASFRKRNTQKSFYRCDSPEEARLFLMTISPSGSATLQVSHKLIDKQTLAGGRSQTTLRTIKGIKCSVCCKVLHKEGWIDPYHYPHRRYVGAIHTVCSSCRQQGIITRPELIAFRRTANLN
jgi:hypothetical protein